MASLSRVLVNISHKLNTPIGNCITTSSYMENLLKTLSEKLETGELSKSNFLKSINDLNYSIEIMSNEFDVSKHFLDQIKAVSQLELEQVKQSINMLIYLKNLENSFQDLVSKQGIIFIIECEDTINIDTSEIILDNIFKVLIDNSIVHGFKEVEKGIIKITITQNDDFICIVYNDNGMGIDSDIINSIYEPLFTTSMGTTSGLGLNILYNTVKTYLNGELEIKSKMNEGVTFNIKIAAH